MIMKAREIKSNGGFKEFEVVLLAEGWSGYINEGIYCEICGENCYPWQPIVLDLHNSVDEPSFYHKSCGK